MRVSRARVAENRERVLQAAADLVARKGFAGVGVAETMAAAGLTHGGFYNHFASKDELQAQACAAAFRRARERVARIGGEQDALRRRAALENFIERYLSPQARDAEAAACPLAAFATDVSRESGPARESYAEGVRAFIDALAPAFAGPRAHDEAAALMASLVGALTLARSLRETDANLSGQILAAARARIVASLPPAGR